MNSMPVKRAREIGIPFEGNPGALNAITDVAGVEVGFSTLITNSGARTGVTAIFPRGRIAKPGVAAATFAFNGTGELTGAHQIREFGGFFGPVLLTGTLSVGMVSDTYLKWVARQFFDDEYRFSRILPVVGETWDGNLNDSWGFHLKPEQVEEALNAASAGPIQEGSIGGGTGMVCHGFKGGTGTASRIFVHRSERYTVGVLVQANHGQRDDLTIAGIPVGRLIQGFTPELPQEELQVVDGSIIVIVATDAPLEANQLERVAKRATIGMARVGGFGGSLSGDIFLAFSTAYDLELEQPELQSRRSIPSDQLDELFHATAWATEEAIINALVAAETMSAGNGLRIHGIPHEQLMHLMSEKTRASAHGSGESSKREI
jgi:L-aminopeptidase/D-esterase-like protein